ncbi:hypothetical protein [Geosporobacter ferrireducens]|uniref:hypothetical protein n=1 Tax=Geosporobacter ferrireducens TaxID=1424294 RepID=UPI00139AF9FF|nr:hypothetical protein [Geosporobacter ferrireducens]MTI54821.1 DUF1963 domain-containing protein [Geosporobacter ferrireducens]
MGSLETIKDKVKRKATVIQIGRFKPDNDLSSSWFGKVMLCLPGEEWPTCKEKPMNALCQINLTQLPSQIQFLTGEEPLAELLALAATVTSSNPLKHHTARPGRFSEGES